MRSTSNPTTKLGMLLIALSLLAPVSAPGQVKDVFRDEVPGLGKKARPPISEPSAPETAVPGPSKPDPRKARPVPVKAAPVPGRTKVVPGGVRPSDVVSLPENDLGVRLLAARVVPGGRARTEVEIEVTNHGPDAFDREASIRVHVSPEDDGTCRWPHDFLRDVPPLRPRERRVIVFEAAQTNASCGAPNSRHPDRSGARASAGIERYGQQFQDRRASNDNHSARLLDLLPAARPANAQPVEILVSFIQPMYAGRGTVELDWLSVELGGDVDRADHAKLRVLGQSGRNTKSHLSVRGGESVLVGSRAFLVRDEVRPGEQVVLRIRARDRDCTGNRDCRRGDTGEFRSIFDVPAFPDGPPPSCDEQTWRLRDLPGYRFELGSGPQFTVGDEGGTTRVCFRAAGG